MGGQVALAKDPDSAMYRDEDGSIFFPGKAQSDFLFVPTKYADEFSTATNLNLKHNIWIECAFSTVVNMVRQQTKNMTVRSVPLCTRFDENRGTDKGMSMCRQMDRNFGFIHPYKIGINGYKKYSQTYDILQVSTT